MATNTHVQVLRTDTTTIYKPWNQVKALYNFEHNIPRIEYMLNELALVDIDVSFHRELLDTFVSTTADLDKYETEEGTINATHKYYDEYAPWLMCTISLYLCRDLLKFRGILNDDNANPLKGATHSKSLGVSAAIVKKPKRKLVKRKSKVVDFNEIDLNAK